MEKLPYFLALFLICPQVIKSIPFDSSFALSDGEDFDAEKYDIVIDQRQNGTQNFRIKVSGLNIAIPDDREEAAPESSPSLQLEQFASLLSPTATNHNQGNNDFADLAAFFDWKKNSDSEKKAADTQSRTKDIPTESQLSLPVKSKVNNTIRNERKKYKLLVGERYIIPLLKFLKNQTDDAEE